MDSDILIVDYCNHGPNGLYVYMTGQMQNKKPYGFWKCYDISGNLTQEIHSGDISVGNGALYQKKLEFKLGDLI